MLLEHYFSSSTLVIGIGRGSIRACTSALIDLVNTAVFVVGYLGLGELSKVTSHVVTLQSDVRSSYAIIYNKLMVLFKK